MQNTFILVLSFHVLLWQVQLVAGFGVGAIRCDELKNPGGNAWRHRRHFGDKAHTVRLNFEHTNHDGEGKTKAIETIPSHEMLSSATTITALVVVPLIILSAQPVLAMDNPLGGGFSISLNDVDPRYFLSGGLCACFSHGITTPVDVVKTRIQSDPQKFDGLDILGASKVIVDEDGYGFLLKGFGSTAVGYGLEGAAKFGLYESLKPTIAGLLHLESPTIAYIIASVVAGGAASVILCPMERTRIRLVTDPSFSEYNTLTGIQRLVEESGVVSLFYGLPAMLSKQCPYTLGKQVTYDAICTALYSVVANVNEASTKVEVSFLAACCAAVVACVLSQPGDVILTESYKQKNGSSLSTSFSTIVSTIYNERPGLSGFYTGIVARLIQVGGIITTQLLLYDFIKQSLGLPATGSS